MEIEGAINPSAKDINKKVRKLVNAEEWYYTWTDVV
jgi:hypothetical protein